MMGKAPAGMGRKDVKMMICCMLGEALEAIDQSQPKIAIENAGHALATAFIICQAPAVSQALGVIAAGYTALRQHADAARYATAAVAVCGERFNLNDFEIGMAKAAPVDVEVPGMETLGYPSKLHTFCLMEAYKALGNAYSAPLHHKMAAEAYAKGLEAVVVLTANGNGTGPIMARTQADLEYNLGNQYMKEVH